ncbi:MAG TPA: hypothetical protein VGG26_06775 [Terracidiphilus sp.]|jgi:hypothetical protein
MKRVLTVAAAVFAFAVMAAQAADSTQVNGWISDSACGAKHVGSGAECVKGCIKSGKAPVFVDEEKKQVWAIDNPEAVKEALYGDHVTMTGTQNADKMSVHIDSIAEAK